MLVVMFATPALTPQKWQKYTRARSSTTKEASLIFSPAFQVLIVFSVLDDVHIPTLTVAQTLGFALSTKTPGKRLPGVSRAGFNETLRTTLLRMFSQTDGCGVRDGWACGMQTRMARHGMRDGRQTKQLVTNL